MRSSCAFFCWFIIIWSSSSTSVSLFFAPFLAFLFLLADFFSFLGGGFFITTWTLDEWIAPIIVCVIALVVGRFTIAGLPFFYLAQLFLMLMWNRASSMKTQFFVKSRLESFHFINHSCPVLHKLSHQVTSCYFKPLPGKRKRYLLV